MHQSVLDNWHTFSRPLEGHEHGMYLDVLGLLTTGVGNLIDASQSGSPTPWAPALELPWKRDSDNELATQDEIRAAWSLLKSHQEYAHRSTKAARALTKLHLDDADIDELVARKLASNAAYVASHYFPMFEQYPADAQLGLMSMAWAVGPGFPTKFPTFKTCVLAGDWESARNACTIREDGNPGVIPRNRANRVCFANAEIVLRCGLARDVLRWPNVAQADVPREERGANLGTLIGLALEDSAEHAKAVELLRDRYFDELGPHGARDLSEADDDETTVVEGAGRA